MTVITRVVAGNYAVDMQYQFFMKMLPPVSPQQGNTNSSEVWCVVWFIPLERVILGTGAIWSDPKMLSMDCPWYYQKNWKLIYTQPWHQFTEKIKCTFCSERCTKEWRLNKLKFREVILNSFKKKRGLPWWRSGWESACQCRGYGFEPWSGKIPHAAEQLGPWATTTEPARLEPVLRNKRGHNSERPAHRDEEWPPACPNYRKP